MLLQHLPGFLTLVNINDNNLGIGQSLRSYTNANTIHFSQRNCDVLQLVGESSISIEFLFFGYGSSKNSKTVTELNVY